MLGAELFSLRRFIQEIEDDSLAWKRVPRHVLSPLVGLVPAIMLIPLRSVGHERLAAFAGLKLPNGLEWNDLLLLTGMVAGTMTQPVAELTHRYFDQILSAIVNQLQRIRLQIFNELFHESAVNRATSPSQTALDSKPVAMQVSEIEPVEQLACSCPVENICQSVLARRNNLDAIHFFRNVADQLGLLDCDIARSTTTHDLVECLHHSAEWHYLGRGNDRVAQEMAQQGLLVVAVLTADDCPDSNGQIAVVLGGPLDPAHARFPRACWAGGPGLTGNFGWLNKAVASPTPGLHSPVERVRYFVRSGAPNQFSAVA